MKTYFYIFVVNVLLSSLIMSFVPFFIRFAIADIGEAPSKIESRMGIPVKKSRREGRFPQDIYFMIYLNQKWVPVVKLKKLLEKLKLEKREISSAYSKQVNKALKEPWRINVIYVDGKSMVEQWFLIDSDNKKVQELTKEKVRPVFRSYKNNRRWEVLTPNEAEKLAEEIDRMVKDDVENEGKTLEPFLFLHSKADNVYFIACDTSVIVMHRNYPEIIKRRREKKNVQDEDYAKAKNMMDGGKYDEALAIYKKYNDLPMILKITELRIVGPLGNRISAGWNSITRLERLLPEIGNEIKQASLEELAIKVNQSEVDYCKFSELPNKIKERIAYLKAEEENIRKREKRKVIENLIGKEKLLEH